MLSKKQVKNVCLHTSYNATAEDMCRYCDFCHGGYNCLKLSSMKKKADATVWRQLANGIDPSMIPFAGDNCKGYPFLPNIAQGYDV